MWASKSVESLPMCLSLPKVKNWSSITNSLIQTFYFGRLLQPATGILDILAAENLCRLASNSSSSWANLSFSEVESSSCFESFFSLSRLRAKIFKHDITSETYKATLPLILHETKTDHDPQCDQDAFSATTSNWPQWQNTWEITSIGPAMNNTFRFCKSSSAFLLRNWFARGVACSRPPTSSCPAPDPHWTICWWLSGLRHLQNHIAEIEFQKYQVYSIHMTYVLFTSFASHDLLRKPCSFGRISPSLPCSFPPVLPGKATNLGMFFWGGNVQNSSNN